MSAQPVARVEFEQPGCGASLGRPANDARAVAGEVVLPMLGWSRRPSGRRRLTEKEVGLGLENAEERVGADERFKLRRFVGRQAALGAPSGQLLVAGLHFLIGLDVGQGAGEFSGHLAGEGTEQSLQRGDSGVVRHAQNIERRAGLGERILPRKRTCSSLRKTPRPLNSSKGVTAERPD